MMSFPLEKLACPEGIEPPTHSLEGCCSIQLSYGQTLMGAGFALSFLK